MVSFLALTLFLAFTPFLCLWFLSVRIKDASIIDIYWGPSFAVTGLIALAISFAVNGAVDGLSLLVSALTILWGARLGIYLFNRNHGNGEDWRYQKMRAGRGDKFERWTLYGVFGLQWLIMSIVSFPAAMTILTGGSINLITLIGVIIFAIGFLFEAIGDAQLSAFKKDPANNGKAMTTGLWAWTRHPNYFGNATLWWGIGVIAVGAGHYWTLIGPAVMTYFLINISGKAMLERKLKNSREGYQEYIANTSGFFPLPPKRR